MFAKKPVEIYKVFEGAMNSGDSEGLFELFDDSAVVVPEPGAEPISGETIREFNKGFFALNPTMTMESKYIVECGDIALLRSVWHFKGTTDSGEVVDMKHNGVEVARRQPDGSWKILIDHPFGAD